MRLEKKSVHFWKTPLEGVFAKACTHTHTYARTQAVAPEHPGKVCTHPVAYLE